MAQRTITVRIDDLTGKDIADGSGESVEFALDGQSYEIDLDTTSAERLRRLLARYVRAGRRVSGSTVGQSKPSEPPAALVDNSAVRAWAASNGIQVSKRGRPSAAVIEQ